jgi:hypothetical protein
MSAKGVIRSQTKSGKLAIRDQKGRETARPNPTALHNPNCETVAPPCLTYFNPNSQEVSAFSFQ